MEDDLPNYFKKTKKNQNTQEYEQYQKNGPSTMKKSNVDRVEEDVQNDSQQKPRVTYVFHHSFQNSISNLFFLQKKKKQNKTI